MEEEIAARRAKTKPEQQNACVGDGVGDDRTTMVVMTDTPELRSLWSTTSDSQRQGTDALGKRGKVFLLRSSSKLNLLEEADAGGASALLGRRGVPRPRHPSTQARARKICGVAAASLDKITGRISSAEW